MTGFRDHGEEIAALLASRDSTGDDRPLTLMGDDCTAAVEELACTATFHVNRQGERSCVCGAIPTMPGFAFRQAREEVQAVEPEPSHAELHARLKLSIRLRKQEREIKELREAVNKLHTALIVAGLWPKGTTL